MLRRCFLQALGVAPAALVEQRPSAAPPEPFTPGEGANRSVGAGQGIHPGRVVWVRDAAATRWDGATGHWWDDAHTDERVVHDMTSRLVRDLTGRKNGKQSWDALFRNLNETHKLGRSGYRPGEKIAIKVNCNQDRSAEWGARGAAARGPLKGLPSPHAIVALVTQLIEVADMRGEDILVYHATATRNVGQPIQTRLRANTHARFQRVQFLAGADHSSGGRISAEPDLANPIRFSKADVPTAFLPRQVSEARYMINMAPRSI